MSEVVDMTMQRSGLLTAVKKYGYSDNWKKENKGNEEVQNDLRDN